MRAREGVKSIARRGSVFFFAASIATIAVSGPRNAGGISAVRSVGVDLPARAIPCRRDRRAPPRRREAARAAGRRRARAAARSRSGRRSRAARARPSPAGSRLRRGRRSPRHRDTRLTRQARPEGARAPPASRATKIGDHVHPRVERRGPRQVLRIDEDALAVRVLREDACCSCPARCRTTRRSNRRARAWGPRGA